MTDYGRKRYPAASSEYILLEEVGQGVSAIVYRARCVRFNDIIAIKILDLERCNSNLEDICREAQIMSLINHSNVVSAYCSFVVDKSLWIVMPYMAGGSCLHIMKSAYPEGFKEVLIATILKETLKALVYLHSHGHIHRDVKAGNILVDSHGVVKLGDFGVAACMFDTGVRQRSRNTFVGTPCWMAPEVMRQIHGYDFKADIWSFGITALELAHGHAPFSKYPPNKVLLMTLQNAPPGLDYERDKKFSKAFKEMVTLCLVKDPTKRPSAEKLLRHSFFKRVKSAEYLVQNILNGLAPLAQRFKDLKIEDAEKLAQKMISSGEKEEISQNEYIRGISGWNFDVEELKAQAALIPDDDDSFTGKESTSSNSSEDIRSLAEINDHLQPFSPPPFKHILVDSSTSPAALSSEGCRDAGDSIKKIRPILLPSPMQLRTTDVSRNEVQPEPTFNENQKRFEATEDNRENMQLGFDGNQNRVEATELEITEAIESGNDEEMPKRKEVKDLRREKVLMAGRRALSGPLNSEYAETGHGSQCEATDRDSSVSSGFDDKRSLYSGATSAYVVPRQYRSLNGLVGLTNSISGIQDVMEKGNTIQRRGRFSVTSENSNLSGIHPIASNGDLLPTSVIIPHLQNILQQSISQQESIRSFMNLLNEAEAPNKNHPLSPLGSRHLSQSSGIITADSLSNLSGNNPTASNSNLFPVSVITPHLQSILQQSMSQQESIRSLMNLLNEAEAPNTYRPSSPLGSGHLSLKVQSLGSPNLSIGNSVDQLQIVKLEMHQ